MLAQCFFVFTATQPLERSLLFFGIQNAFLFCRVFEMTAASGASGGCAADYRLPRDAATLPRDAFGAHGGKSERSSRRMYGVTA